MEDNRFDRQVNKAVEARTGTCGCYRCNHRVAVEKCIRVVRASGAAAYLCESCQKGRAAPRAAAKKRAVQLRTKGGAK